ncbi:MAG: hypothetical protein CMJ83_09560 [Planctomycetes bacterium]|nr:hypothetical protein [Planctomycetota bacterium]
MNQRCRKIQEGLLAVALQEATARMRDHVQAHVAVCEACRSELERCRDLDDVMTALKVEPAVAEVGSRDRLRVSLIDLRGRILRYRVFESPLGRICVGRTELGVALVTFLGRARSPRVPGLELMEDGSQEFERLGSELLDYLHGKRAVLDWQLDLRLAKSDFQRTVLETTGRIPYGAVTSYASVARELGRPKATRAVAQALRNNPVSLVVPCHRVIGANGALTGYAGNRVGLKRRILAVEGIPTVTKPGVPRIRRAAMYHHVGHEEAYCVPTCPGLPERSLARITLFATRAHAESCGLSPCRVCRPDTHPIAG